MAPDSPSSAAPPQVLYIGEHPPGAWRRFYFAQCEDCGWYAAYRTYRSKRTANTRRRTKAATKHQAEHEGHRVTTGVCHG